MTYWSRDFVGQDHQKLRLQRNLGDAFQVVIRALFPHHSTKAVASKLGVDAKTAENALAAKAGGAAITRSLHHRQAHHDDHWDLWDALGALLFGETRDQYDERKLAALIEKTEHVRTITEERRRRRAALEERPPAPTRLEHRQAAD